MMRSVLWYLMASILYTSGVAILVHATETPRGRPDLPAFASRKPGQCPRPPECPDCAPATAFAK